MEKKGDSEPRRPAYEAPKGAGREFSMTAGGEELHYTAAADWIVLRKEHVPKAEMFYVSYTLRGDQQQSARPLTFVFNGGPGASSVFLHLGAMGPKRAVFASDGAAAAPPHRLVDNEETWLRFTDLVFVDPIGTGFSRMIEEPEQAKDEKNGKPGSEYWKLMRDLESLGEYIRTYLSKHHRWESPIYIAGESYGGFRTAKLTRLLQKEYGVGLCGAVIISPALEFTLLDGSDYSALNWIDTFPVMAAAACIHGRSRGQKPDEDLQDRMRRAEQFAVNELLPVLAAGDMFGERKKAQTLNRAADMIGLPRSIVQAKNGRIAVDYFVKNLLRDREELLGLYDISLTAPDPYPDRDSYAGPDPTLHQSDRVFAAGINTQLRSTLGLETERDYEILSMRVNKEWEVDTREHALDSEVGATDDLRFGMSLNPGMKVFLTHGYYDLVTPYFAAERISRLMKLTDTRRRTLTMKHYPGGHMFYVREESRRAFFHDIRRWMEGS
jgi:carboxypeptidase C (cathepsin A)